MTKQRVKHSTWCGVPLELYRRKKAELSREDFAVWWAKKTGRPVDIRGIKKDPVGSSPKYKFYAPEENIYVLESIINEQREYIRKLENRSWIQRLFNSKV